MKKIKLPAGILIPLLFLALSCEKPDYTYTGPSVAEFAPRTTSSTYTTAFSASIKQANYVAGLDTVEIVLNLVGAQRDEDINLEYTLVTDTVWDFPSATYFIAPTTAVEGTHFAFLPARSGNANGVVTIPANSSTGIIRLNSIAAQVSPDVSKRVVIRLLPAADMPVNPNFQYFILTITRV